MDNRNIDELVIFAYTSASARARREQAKAVRAGVRRAIAWLKNRNPSRNAKRAAQPLATTSCQS